MALSLRIARLRAVPSPPAPLPPAAAAAPERSAPSAYWPFWRQALGASDLRPVEDLYGALFERFVGRIAFEDRDDFARWQDQPVLYLANHQVALESMLFLIALSALSANMVNVVAKEAHRWTWVGELFALTFGFPGVRDPETTYYYYEYDPAGMAPLVQRIVADMTAKRRSLLVHAEGTRVLAAGHLMTQLGAVFIDIALRVGCPIVPVRFAGGLPVEPMAAFLDFPFGYARQDIHVGRAIAPAALAGLALNDRKAHVLARLNALGGGPDAQRPNPGDPAFAAMVRFHAEATGIGEAKTVLWQALAAVRGGCAETSALAAGLAAGTLDVPDTARGRWLADFARWLSDGQVLVRFSPER
ncbi:MAG: 1-acyl-sn-glycerol-3-phosphate acyltransferase [Rhodospirillales bacterium]